MTPPSQRHLAAILALALVAPRAEAQFCPSYATCRAAPARAINPDPATLAAVFDRIAEGPAHYGTLGWAFTATLPDGCGIPTPPREVPAVFPCVILKAIALTESPPWRQFCVPTAPSPGTASQTLIRSDCGYGLMGISRGMHVGETSEYDPARVASDPGYNVSVGAALLAEAWRAMPCVGDRRVGVVEDWYFAVWAYGGLTYRNNPSNPLYRADRPMYRSAAGLTAGEYPYQEVVFGWIRSPASAAHFAPVPVSLPRRSEICGTCGGPNANIRDPDEVHASECPDGRDGGVDAAADAGPDAVVADAPVRDVFVAELSSDAPRATDVLGADAGSSAEEPASGGCGCRAVARRTSAEWLIVGLVTVRKRRRRSVFVRVRVQD